MKVVYIFRDPSKGGYSIEEIFLGIVNHLPIDIQPTLFHYNQNEPFWRNILRLRSIKSDAYHITGGVNYLALFLPFKKLVLTIHDIGHYKNLKGWRKHAFGWLWIRLPMHSSKYITAVSKYTKEDLLRFFPTCSQSVKVVPNPVPAIFKYVPAPFNSLKPRILVVGTGTHKNLPTLFSAVSGIPCCLAIIGPLDHSLLAQLKRLNIEYEQFTNLTQEEVNAQYLACDLVSFVTTHEGFGMPVLEAQAVGRPIITSTVCSLPEVTNGTTATVEDPLDVAALRSQLLRITQEPDYRARLIEAGLNNVQRFNISEIVQSYVKVYKSIIN